MFKRKKRTVINITNVENTGKINISGRDIDREKND